MFFEEVGIRNWFRAVTLNSSIVCWRVVVTIPFSIAPTTLLGGEVRVHV